MDDRRVKQAVCAAASALALTLTRGARADDHTLPAEPIEVTVRQTREPDTFTTTRAASAISAVELRDDAPGSLADAVRTRGLVTVQQTTPGQGTLYVRGLAGREVLTAIDGVRLNTAIFRSPNNAASALVDPLGLHAIEVIRGPSSVLHASDALGGVVWLTTRLPGYVVGREGTEVTAYEGLSSNAPGTSTRVAVSHRAESWSAHAGLTYQSFGDVRPGGGQLTPDPASYAGLEKPAPTGADGAAYAPRLRAVEVGTGFQRVALDAAARRRLGPSSEIVLRAQLARRPELARYDELTPRFGGDAPARAESSLELHRIMSSITFIHRPSTRPFLLESVRVMGAFQRMGEDLHRRSMREVCVTGEAECRSRLRLVPAGSAQDERTRSDALTARAEARFLSASRRSGGTLGVEVVHDIVTSSVEGTPAPRYPSGSTMTLAGAFTEVEHHLAPSLRVHAGARVSGFFVDVPARADAAAIGANLADVGLGAGLGWEATPGVTFVANLGRGVRAPNIEDFAALGSRAGRRFQVPNPDLRPEHVHSIDTGIKVKRGLFRAQSFVFYSVFDDAIGIQDTTLGGATRAADGARYVRSENVSTLRFFGVESEGRIGTDDGGGVYVRQLATGFSEEARPGVSAAERVLSPPQLMVGGYWFPTPSLRLETFAHARDAQRRVTNPDDNRVPPGGTPGSVSLHARLRWALTPSVTARLAVDNAADALILEHGSGFYAAGFSTSASLEARLGL